MLVQPEDRERERLTASKLFIHLAIRNEVFTPVSVLGQYRNLHLPRPVLEDILGDHPE